MVGTTPLSIQATQRVPKLLRKLSVQRELWTEDEPKRGWPDKFLGL